MIGLVVAAILCGAYWVLTTPLTRVIATARTEFWSTRRQLLAGVYLLAHLASGAAFVVLVALVLIGLVLGWR